MYLNNPCICIFTHAFYNLKSDYIFVTNWRLFEEENPLTNRYNINTEKKNTFVKQIILRMHTLIYHPFSLDVSNTTFLFKICSYQRLTLSLAIFIKKKYIYCKKTNITEIPMSCSHFLSSWVWTCKSFLFGILQQPIPRTHLIYFF